MLSTACKHNESLLKIGLLSQQNRTILIQSLQKYPCKFIYKLHKATQKHSSILAVAPELFA